MNKKLYRSRTDKKIAGVCGGLANYLNIDSTLLRLCFALLIIFGGVSIWVYIIAALIMPEEPEYENYSSDPNNFNNRQ